jgi:CheY-like chemotaxis protein/HPt (histidine-containing phosphotransfer) domain-containing protein
VTSEEGKGSEFRFTAALRKQPEAARRDETRPSAAAAVPRFERRGVRILLVDDSHANRSVALGMLKKLGLSADTTENGEQALAALERGKYDLVLMDCQMPVMDGYEATRRIRAFEGEAGKIPVVAMTANAMFGDREECLEAGMDDHIAKPVSRAELVEALNRWLPQAASEEASATCEAFPKQVRSDAPEETVWNRAFMLEVCDGDEKMAEEVGAEVLNEMPAELADLSEALSGKKMEVVKRRAHAIKGLAGIVGADAMRASALELEEAARADDWPGAAVLAARLEGEFERLRKAMHAYRNG